MSRPFDSVPTHGETTGPRELTDHEEPILGGVSALTPEIASIAVIWYCGYFDLLDAAVARWAAGVMHAALDSLQVALGG
jgi:hypothetical protein